MATKKNRKKATASDSPVQFRPGSLLAALLADVAAKWSLSRNEAARRLAAMALYELDIRHYDLIAEVAKQMVGDRDFADSCERIHIELAATNRARQQTGQLALTEIERQEHIQSVVNLICCQRGFFTDGKQKEKQQVQVHERLN